MPLVTFDALPANSAITFGSPPWQLPEGEFWAAPFFWGNGQATTGGFARIDSQGYAHGSNNEAGLSNVNVCFRALPYTPSISLVEFAFGEYGGNLNLMVNGQLVNFGNFQDIHQQVIGGVTVDVLFGGGGQDYGKIVLLGNMSEQYYGANLWGHLAIGGQELWIDDLRWQ